jgi:hypothetical protein
VTSATLKILNRYESGEQIDNPNTNARGVENAAAVYVTEFCLEELGNPPEF